MKFDIYLLLGYLWIVFHILQRINMAVERGNSTSVLASMPNAGECLDNTFIFKFIHVRCYVSYMLCQIGYLNIYKGFFTF